MGVEVHVEGRIVMGKLPEFMQAVRRYCAFAQEHDYAAPRVLQGLSGAMNTVRLVYAYPDLGTYERDEVRTAEDREYGAVAMGMPFAEGTVTYAIYHVG